MEAASIIIVLQDGPDGRKVVDHIVAGELPLELAANACRMIADKLDRERIEAEIREQVEVDDATQS